MNHHEHGRGTAEDGPDDSDCPCRATLLQDECASTGCGFCRVAFPLGPALTRALLIATEYPKE